MCYITMSHWPKVVALDSRHRQSVSVQSGELYLVSLTAVVDVDHCADIARFKRIVG